MNTDRKEEFTLADAILRFAIMAFIFTLALIITSNH